MVYDGCHATSKFTSQISEERILLPDNSGFVLGNVSNFSKCFFLLKLVCVCTVAVYS